MALGERIKEARQRRGLTQEQLARSAGLTLNAYGDIERNVHDNPHVQSVMRIAAALDVPVSALLGEEAEAAPLAEALLSISLPPVVDFDLETVEARVIEVVRPQTRVELNEAIETLLANRYSESELLELRRNSLNRVDELAPEKEDHLNEYSRVVSTANLASRVLERIGAKDLA